MNPTIMYEDNSACIAQMRACYIKSNLTKHMAPKLFYPHQLQEVGEIEILQTKLNLVIILQICSQNHYQHPYSINTFLKLV
jgi:hypothetical protein